MQSRYATLTDFHLGFAKVSEYGIRRDSEPVLTLNLEPSLNSITHTASLNLYWIVI